MATVNDLYIAMFGFHAEREAIQRYQREAFEAHKLVHKTWFVMPMLTSNCMMLDVRVDASKAFYNIFTLADFTFSKSHKNYTLNKGNRGQARTSITMPKVSEIKKHPAYLQMIEDNKVWALARDKAAKNMIEEGMSDELEKVLPDFRRIIALKDDEVEAYLKSKGWTIGEGVTFDNWRPCGWIMTTEPDGFGHQRGSYAAVDWNEKTIKSQGWSSDD